MLDEFDINKKYIFDIKCALKDKYLKATYKSGESKFWIDYCNRKFINVISDLLKEKDFKVTNINNEDNDKYVDELELLGLKKR